MIFSGTVLRTRVGRRILGLFAICAILPIVALGIVSYKQVVTQLEYQARDRMRGASTSAGMAIIERLGLLDAELNVVAGRLAEVPDIDGSEQSALAAMVESRFGGLFVELEDGRIITLVGSMTEPPERSAAEEQHLQSGRTLLVTEPGPDGVVTLMGKALDAALLATSVLWAQVPTEYLWGYDEDAVIFPPQMEMCVLHWASSPLYCSVSVPGSVLARFSPENSPETTGYVDWNDDGDEYLAAHWEIFLRAQWGSPSWRVLLSEPRANVLAPIATFRRTFFLVLLLSFLVVLFASNVQIRKSLDPLEELREATKRIAAKNFENPVAISSGDEFEELAESFNRMASRLKHQFGESERLNTALTQASESLRESETRLRTILETAADGIVTTDVQGQILSFNKTAEAMFGYSREQAEGNAFGMLMADTRTSANDRGITTYQTVGATSRELLGKRQDGSVFPLELSVTELHLGDRKLFTGFLRDISSRKQAEEERTALESQLHQAQKLETIGTLAGGIAHDFNNILGPIIGFADLGLLDAPEDSALHDDLTEIRSAAGRAKDLVGQILLMSRRAEHETKPIQIQVIAKEALKLLRASLPTTIEIQHNLSHDTPPVLGDPTQIHQVLMNLCTNASHAMRERGGKLTVTLDPVGVGSELGDNNPNLGPGNFARLSVSDTGHGMDATTIERLFEPFFTTKAAGEGTGLGMSVVHGIVSKHGGDITVASEVGKGTTFAVYLPTAEDVVVADADPDQVQVGGNERILLVEDDSQHALVLEKVLERLGYRVTVTANGAEALSTFSANPGDFELVLTDRTMPRMTGLELEQEIHRLWPDQPMILTTGFSDGLKGQGATEHGFDDILLKPLSLTDLGEAVRRILDERCALPE